MWFAVHEGTSKKIALLPDKEYIVGRKDCDIVLDNDKSISRRHASVKICRAAPEQSQSANDQQPRPVFTDLSRFGTLVNNTTVCGSSQELRHGDVLTFGQYKAVVRILLEPLVVTTSCLDSTAKRTLHAAVHALGGQVVKEWERGETTYLVMSRITVTPKAVCCLIEQRFIVTPNFFTDMLAACAEHKQLPSADSYCPELSDSQVNPLTASFQPNPARAAIFRGKTFIFLQRRVFSLLSRVIELGGGLCRLLEGKPQPPGDAGELVAPGSIVLHADFRDAPALLGSSQWIAEARAILKQHGKRMVQEAEIGYAVLLGSTESYCNPDREAGRRLFLSMSQSVTSTQQPLVVDTQIMSVDGMCAIPPRTPLVNNSACAATVVPSSVVSSIDEQPEPESSKKRVRQSNRSSSPERAAETAAPRESISAVPRESARCRAGDDTKLAASARLTGRAAVAGTLLAWTSPKATAARPLQAASTASSVAELSQKNGSRAADGGGVRCGRDRGDCLVTAAAQEKKAAMTQETSQALLVPQACGGPSPESATSRAAELSANVKRERSPVAHPSVADIRGKTGRQAVAAAGFNAPSDRNAVPTIKREAIDDESASTSASAAVLLASRAGAEMDATSSDCGGMNVIVQSLMREDVSDVAAAVAQSCRAIADQNKNGFTLWNGKWVKNFKRFLKCGASDLGTLPRIIGGGDLVGAAALKRARLSCDDPEDACPVQPLAAARRRVCDDWDNGSTSDREEEDVHVTAVPRSHSRPSTVTRTFVDDDSMDDSSQQSRINAIFDRVAGRHSKR